MARPILKPTSDVQWNSLNLNGLSLDMNSRDAPHTDLL